MSTLSLSGGSISPSEGAAENNSGSMGRRGFTNNTIFGGIQPPANWIGPEPSNSCELFIRRIPHMPHMPLLIKPFERFGQIYEMRVPLDFDRVMRGYAYIKYTNEKSAECALYVMSHYQILARHRLEVLYSYEKSRLFVANIPTHLTEDEVAEALRAVFPKTERIFSRSTGNMPLGVLEEANAQRPLLDVNDDESEGPQRNPGHAFVQFKSHRLAAESKRQKCRNGLLDLFGRELRVVWANSQPESGMCTTTKTLFVRNVDPTVTNQDIVDLIGKCVQRTLLRRINRTQNVAFFEFSTREGADNCMKQMQGCYLHNKRLEVEWARPSESQLMQKMRRTDFDALVRVKCIANNWHIPIIIFGAYYEQESLQYAVVLLRDSNGFTRAIFCVFPVLELRDIHSRLCEVVCVLIDRISWFPDYNYVFYVEKEMAHLLGLVSHTAESVDFIASRNVPQEYALDLNEIFDLSFGIVSLVELDEDTLLHLYNESFLSSNIFTYLPWCTAGGRIFGTIMPKYRNKQPLPFSLNDTQIVLALCFCQTGTNTSLPVRPYAPSPVHQFDKNNNMLDYIALTLLPLNVVQSRVAINHALPFVKFGGVQYYHPAQRFMAPPLWLTGYTYRKTIYEMGPDGQPLGPSTAERDGNDPNAPTNGLLATPASGGQQQQQYSGMQLPQHLMNLAGGGGGGPGAMQSQPLLQYPMHYIGMAAGAGDGRPPLIASPFNATDGNGSDPLASGMPPYVDASIFGGMGAGNMQPLQNPINYGGEIFGQGANGMQSLFNNDPGQSQGAAGDGGTQTPSDIGATGNGESSYLGLGGLLQMPQNPQAQTPRNNE